MDTGQPGIDILMREQQIFNEWGLLPCGTKIYKGGQSDSGIFQSLVNSVLTS